MDNKIFRFFDKLEDYLRHTLSRMPLVYTLVGGVAIVLFWKGVWETAEWFPFLYGPFAIIISVIILLSIGLFVSFFIGDQIIISGLKGEKKLIEKTEDEIRLETSHLDRIHKELKELRKIVEEIRSRKS